jgi:DNA-binding transcriptional regulator YiaG
MTPIELRAIRAKLQLTQRGLASKVGVTPNTVARWEQGVRKIPAPTAKLILSLR